MRFRIKLLLVRLCKLILLIPSLVIITFYVIITRDSNAFKMNRFNYTIFVMSRIIFYMILRKRLVVPSYKTPGPLTDESSVPWYNKRYCENKIIEFSFLFYTGCMLKNSGFFKLSYAYFLFLEKFKSLKYFAYLGLADLNHLSYLWSKQYKSYYGDIHKITEIQEFLDREYVVSYGARSEVVYKKALEYYLKALDIKKSDVYASERLCQLHVDNREIDKALNIMKNLILDINMLNKKNELQFILPKYEDLMKKQNMYLYTLENDIRELISHQDIPCRYIEDSHVETYKKSIESCNISQYFQKNFYETSFSYNQNQLFWYRLTNVETTGNGLISIDRQYFIEETTNTNYEHIKLFSPEINIINDRYVFCNVSDLNRSKLFYTTVVLPVCVTDNFYHFVLEYLPTILHFKKVIEDTGAKLLIRDLKSWHKDLLLFFGINIDAVKTIKSFKEYIFKDALILSNLSKMCVPTKRAINLLRDIVIKSPLYNKNIIPGLRIFLIRNNSFDRNIINIANVEKVLQKNKFIFIDPEGLSIENVVDLFSKAEIICAQGGAALTNIIFSNVLTKIIQISSPEQYGCTFNIISSVLNQEQYVFQAVGQIRPNMYNIWSNSNIYVPIDEFNEFIELIINKK
ncbi:hypothetical protein SZ25_00278 [Candidatus Arcanobacter lacustris]|uniref:Glycosyltransferase 61 catalytic domain-containing protein n=1 Tax=Candidatus Arcanibacter lacustris TaxID=1607817 RepID=A0A0F5MRB8_9RICK|nr:hypothetical protein SZ25_00423 [Candidatus Arcanobacter lacustris]KKB96622.1 hypothetical protein SZ25_00278 [Candidatus Arcanobacter lacustris]